MKRSVFVLERRYLMNGDWSEPIPDEKLAEGPAEEWRDVKHPIYKHIRVQERVSKFVPATEEE